MATDNSEQVSYSAAQLRENLPDLDETHPHAGLVQDAGKREMISYLASVHRGDIEQTEIYQDIVRTEATESLTNAVNAGNVSEMQFAVGMVSHEESAQSAQAWLRDNLLSEAYVGWVTGGMGTGKTAFALDRADDWHHATRGRVATNIQSAAERNEPIEFVGGFEDLREFYGEASTDVLAIIDETDQRLSGKGADSQYADALADTLKLVRKGDSGRCYRGILLVGQTIRGASKELRRLVTSNGHLYHKTSKTRVEVYDDVVTGELSAKTPVRTVTGLRDTRFNFDTGEASEFDVSGALDEDGDDSDGTELTRQQAIETALKAVKPWNEDIGVSQADAADIVDYSAGWVNDRVREWRNGEHRDLVNDPH